MNTKSILVTICLGSTLFLAEVYAQVGISYDGSKPASSAGLDIKFTDKGLLIPRLTVLQQRMIENPDTGLMVFNIDSLDLFIFTGDYWLSVLKSEDKDTIVPWSCGKSFTIHHLQSGGIAPVDKKVTYGTVTNIPGESSKCWINSNLGSDHQAAAVNDVTEASAGWYWQFNHKQGYKHDGTTRTPNTAWISSIDENLDWEAANDPCTHELGFNWRLPSFSEWRNVDANGNWTDWNGPWNSGLKLHAAGSLSSSDGSLFDLGTGAGYSSITQSSSVNGTYLTFDAVSCYMDNNNKTFGFPLRCLRDAQTQQLPGIFTSEATDLSPTSATSGGNVTFDGGPSVTARGICWSTSSNPTTADNHTTDGSGTGVFVSSLTGLIPNTLYYTRAYAINNIGTGYGDEVSFSTPPFSIGLNYGGGIIFYIDDTELHGLIAAPSDQSTGAEWGCVETLIGSSGIGIGTGQANTTAIVNGCGTSGIAARICNELELNGYDDWFLPSKDELLQMYLHKSVITDIANEPTSPPYWSSSEYSEYEAWIHYFYSGQQNHYYKAIANGVRAIRAF